MLLVERISSQEMKTKVTDFQSFTKFKTNSSNMNVAAKSMNQAFHPLVHA